MAAIKLNLKPDNRILRQFGWIGAMVLPPLGWFFAGKPTFATWQPSHWQIFGPFLVGGMALAALATIKPSLLKWLFITASVVTFPIGFVLGEVLMGGIFILVFAPVALLFRFGGRDALKRGIDKDAASYWEPKQSPKDMTSYYRQS